MKTSSLWSLFLQKLERLVLSRKLAYRCSIEFMYFLSKQKATSPLPPIFSRTSSGSSRCQSNSLSKTRPHCL